MYTVFRKYVGNKHIVEKTVLYCTSRDSNFQEKCIEILILTTHIFSASK